MLTHPRPSSLYCIKRQSTPNKSHSLYFRIIFTSLGHNHGVNAVVFCQLAAPHCTMLCTVLPSSSVHICSFYPGLLSVVYHWTEFYNSEERKLLKLLTSIRRSFLKANSFLNRSPQLSFKVTPFCVRHILCKFASHSHTAYSAENALFCRIIELLVIKMTKR